MDNYLDGMGEYKTTVSPADTLQWGTHKPSKQQQSLIQDSMAFDVQQMRLIQEARLELEKHGTSIAPDPGSPTVQLVAEAETVSLYFNTAEDGYVYATITTSTGFAFVEYWDGTSEVIGNGELDAGLYFEKYIEIGDPYPVPRLVQITSCDANGGI